MIQRLKPFRIHLSPDDHGREMSLDDFERATGEGGYKYELIDGRIYVSTMPDPPQDSIEMRVLWQLLGYRYEHPEVINHVTNKLRVFVPGHRRPTCPEPDIAAFRDYPHERAAQRTLRWNEVSPIVVGEVVSPGDPWKDFTRNVELYLQVPSIREYWIFHPDEESGYPAMLVYRRRGRKWQKPIAVPPGGTYTTKLLPGFELTLNAPEA